MTTLNDSDFKNLKALHVAARSALRTAHKKGGDEHRCAILASAFLRGRPYRQHERSHHRSTNMDGSTHEHNLPGAAALYFAIAPILRVLPHDPTGAIPLQRLDSRALDEAIAAWLADPSGAKPVPARAPKKPFVRPVAAAVAVAAE